MSKGQKGTIAINKALIIEVILLTLTLLFLFFGDDITYPLFQDSPTGVLIFNRLFTSAFIILLATVAFVWYVIYRIIQAVKHDLPEKFFKWYYILAKILLLVAYVIVVAGFFSLLSPVIKDVNAEEEYTTAKVLSIENTYNFSERIKVVVGDETPEILDCYYLNYNSVVKNRTYRFRVFNNCNVIVPVEMLEGE